MRAPQRRVVVQPVAVKASTEDSDTLANAGYTDLMLCDPLSARRHAGCTHGVAGERTSFSAANGGFGSGI